MKNREFQFKEKSKKEEGTTLCTNCTCNGCICTVAIPNSAYYSLCEWVVLLRASLFFPSQCFSIACQINHCSPKFLFLFLWFTLFACACICVYMSQVSSWNCIHVLLWNLTENPLSAIHSRIKNQQANHKLKERTCCSLTAAHIPLVHFHSLFIWHIRYGMRSYEHW